MEHGTDPLLVQESVQVLYFVKDMSRHMGQHIITSILIVFSYKVTDKIQLYDCMVETELDIVYSSI